jgi:hypothetical protein
MTEKIKLRKRDFFVQRGATIPGHIWKEQPFKFDPVTFAVEDEKLEKRFFEASVQEKSLQGFLENPAAPHVYAVASEPNDSRALYFAAYLVQCYLESTQPPWRVAWENLYGGFSNKLLDAEIEPSFLVLSNLSPNSTNVKLEKARDLLTYYAHIPRVVVIAGEDPITFFARRLFFKTGRIFFHSSSIIKRQVQVV